MIAADALNISAMIAKMNIPAYPDTGSNDRFKVLSEESVILDIVYRL